jgi:hypothetical protein
MIIINIPLLSMTGFKKLHHDILLHEQSSSLSTFPAKVANAVTNMELQDD